MSRHGPFGEKPEDLSAERTVVTREPTTGSAFHGSLSFARFAADKG
jgi:hypothetical protein